MGSQSKKWDRLAYAHNREREIASHAYLDLIACRNTENVKLALELKLGSPMVIEVPYILELIGDVQGKRVLDAGCGGGFYSLLLSERGAAVLGIDSSDDMIKIAKQKALKDRLDAEFLTGNLSDLKIQDEEFDLVLSTLVLMDVKELDRTIAQLVRAVRKGGAIILSVQHPILTAGSWERKEGEKLFRKLDHYFTERELETVWETHEKELVSFKYYHRSLQAYVQPFLERACVLTHLIEPRPHEVYKTLNLQEYEDARRIPHFVILRFHKISLSDSCG